MTWCASRNRPASSSVATNATAVTGPTPPAFEVDPSAWVTASGAFDSWEAADGAQELVDLDLMGSTEYWVTLDDPLVQWLPSPRALGGSGPSDNLWLRIVDLPTAVAERGHAADLDVGVEIGDAILPEQAGRWRWTAARDGVGALERTDAAADVTLDIGDLGAVWLGGQTIAARAAAGYVTGDPAAGAALDAALRTPTGPVTTIDF